MTTERAKTSTSSTRASKTSSKPAGVSPRESDIRERAFFLWEKAGKPHGRDVEFWEKAKKELQG